MVSFNVFVLKDTPCLFSDVNVQRAVPRYVCMHLTIGKEKAIHEVHINVENRMKGLQMWEKIRGYDVANGSSTSLLRCV